MKYLPLSKNFAAKLKPEKGNTMCYHMYVLFWENDGNCQVAPFLKNLSLADNPIRSIAELNYLSDFEDSLRELCNQFLLCLLCCLLKKKKKKKKKSLDETGESARLYQHEVTKRFRGLIKLDNRELFDPLVSFGETLDEILGTLDKHSSLPVSSHHPSSASSEAFNFVSQYLRRFDANRQSLLDVYHTDAAFSLTFLERNFDLNYKSEQLFQTQNTIDSQHGLSGVLKTLNRNLCDQGFQQLSRSRQNQMVLLGKLAILKFFTDKFPETRHDTSLITVDGQMISLIENQTFCQVMFHGYYGESEKSARKFQRTLLLMISGGKPLIINDQFHIGRALNQLQVKAKPPPGSSADQKAVKVQSSLSESDKNELIRKVAGHCKVHENIAQQALEHSEWDSNIAINKIQTKQRASN
ncbi:nuclear RNA export factor 1-like protein [Reticulomyxa filosa]|uniref:Nuclear RNA export factor 1-like protein n=1 Tax=Reticulomyxa filosa TaxID=46433 RepID=X6NDF5_RETFI|nr:nuclear RNA export factor 1-like protein [Reticulomyxa filosa]|eukprot:ETO24360.1 nuclear RNA export factor 1-like protein [Reticulomyxa filosa]